MTAILAESAGRVSGASGAVSVPGAAGEGGPGAQEPPGPSSHLAELKHERAKLRKRLPKLEKARASPSLELAEIESERRLLDDDSAARLSDWARGGCNGAQPIPYATRIDDIARRHEAAVRACEAATAPIAEVDRQLVDTRARLRTLEGEIGAEAARVLVSGLEAELKAVQKAADELNGRLAQVMGLRSFLHRQGGSGLPQLAWQVSQARTPEIGATRAETEAAAKEWQHRFEELVA
jgi:chromosome segregation ATPase